MTDAIRVPIEDDQGQVIAWLEGTRDEIETALDLMLALRLKFRSQERRDTIERRVLRAFSYMNREHGAEHTKRTGRRRAGGGSLTKGS